MLKMELSQLKGKYHMQPSQDNRDYMVKKLENGSTVTCAKLSQINLKTSYQKVDKTKIKKKAHVKCFEYSTLGHFSFECPNKQNDQAKLSRRQRSLSQRMCFAYKEKCYNITDCPKEGASKKIYQNWRVRFGKPAYPILVENFRTSGQFNKCFKVALGKHMSKNESTKMHPRTKQVESSINLATLAVTKLTLVRIAVKLKLSFIRLSMIIYHMWDSRMIVALSRWLVHLMVVLVPFGYQNFIDQVVGDLRCFESLTINKKMESLLYCKCINHYTNIDSMQSQGQVKCLSM
jgi:hypothetical protein